MMTSFHNDPAVKAKFLARVQVHRLAEELAQGRGWTNGKGCAVGCTLEDYDHSQYPVELGLPVWLAYLEDHIFEALAPAEAQHWPEQFLTAIQEGVTESALSVVRDQFQIFWLERQKTQIDCIKSGAVSQAIDSVIDLLRSAISGTEPESATWSAARSAARSEAIVKRDWLLAALSALKKGA